ncbi:hypothetical protein RhiirA5_414178 [Rhizophagus irregularis]|uniref:Endonuclease/exonuclease/phosphatase domain-containing protein n=2 Tax=Rhizophagus irregularis TaxID=588596 RepID=A0A2N0PUU1_9GLOM|nr:hypothetical protein RhiirA5_414178 [Rhizophagus irregularis]
MYSEKITINDDAKTNYNHVIQFNSRPNNNSTNGQYQNSRQTSKALAITAKLEAKIEKLSETFNLLQNNKTPTTSRYPQLNNRIDELTTHFSNVTSRQNKLEASHSSINTKLIFSSTPFKITTTRNLHHNKKRTQLNEKIFLASKTKTTKQTRLQYSFNYKNPPSSSFPVNQDLNQQLTHTPQHVRETYDTQVEEMLKYIEQNLDDLLTSTFSSSTSSTNTTNNTTPQPHTHIIDYHKIGFINIHGAFNQKLNNILQFFKTQNFDILTLTETGLHNINPDNNKSSVNSHDLPSYNNSNLPENHLYTRTHQELPKAVEYP